MGTCGLVAEFALLHRIAAPQCFGREFAPGIDALVVLDAGRTAGNSFKPSPAQPS